MCSFFLACLLGHPGRLQRASSCQDTALASMGGKGSDPSSSAAAFSPSMGRYKAQNYPSNCEKITILNTTSLEAEVHFFFEHDLKADTFLLDPPSMTLKPNKKQVGDGQAAVAAPGGCSSCSPNPLFCFFGELGAEPLGVPHVSWPH